MGVRKVTGLIDEEGHDHIKAYMAKHSVGLEDATSIALKMGTGRMGSLKRYADKQKKGEKRAAKAAAPKAKAAAKPAKAKAAAKPVKAAAKVAAKAKPKAVAKPRAAAASAKPVKKAVNGEKPKRSSLLSTAKKGNASRLGPQKPALPLAAANGSPAVTTAEVAEA
jgi:hypothetical protein